MKQPLDTSYRYGRSVSGIEGIDDITAEEVKIYSCGSEIIIEGAENAYALVYDIMGRIFHRGRTEGLIRVNGYTARI